MQSNSKGQKASGLRGRAKVIAVVLASALLVISAPLTALAAEYNYKTGAANVSQWYYSGHRDMNGARVLAVNSFQQLVLKNGPTSTLYGWDNVTVSHSLTYTVSQCAWNSPFVPSPPPTAITCKYWR
ncbi:hypothetical protein [Microbacterium sp. RU33B]|uniref:hypothetical protein n=1 Tax=Microbacterium sp. RU33B TaxID=1907390 RepID=UPI00095F7840|nr:hypothetical protein [Microbacterium sp. RU33B]SIT72072.1 hypothetical protein SAMN05880545_0991 [Microbacterium sp. RU33B]